MFNVDSAVQSVLDACGIHLDQQSFDNLMAMLRLRNLSWTQKLGISVGIGVLAEIIRTRRNDAAKAAAAAAAAAVQP